MVVPVWQTRDGKTFPTEKEAAEYEVRKFPSTPVQKMADMIHTAICRSSHADQCGWMYEDWTDIRIGSSKKSYMDKALKIQSLGIELDKLESLFQILKGS